MNFRFSQIFTPSRRQPLPTRFIPRCEVLEDRITPMANVTSAFASGTLTITATNVTAPVGQVDPLQNANILFIIGTAPGTFTVNAIGSIAFVCNTTNLSTTVTAVIAGATSGISPGDKVSGPGILANTTVASIIDGTTFTLSQAANADGTNVGLFFTRGQIDGQDTKSFPNVKSIVLNLGLGDDAVTMRSSILSGTLTVNGGDGNNSVIIDAEDGGATVKNSFGNVTVNNGAGYDTFGIGNGTNQITGKLTINNGNGGSDTELGEGASIVSVSGLDDATIGSVTITNGNGNNFVSGRGAKLTVNGAMTIKNGNGHEEILLGYKTSLSTGALSITNGAGYHEISLGDFGTPNTVSTKSVTITNGNGDSSIGFGSLGSTKITGNLKITNLAGYDSFYLNNQSGSSFTVTGTTTISNGNGACDVNFGSDNLTLTGSTLITNGDTLNGNPSGPQNKVTFGKFSSSTIALGSVTISNGNGTSDTEISDAVISSKLTGNFTVTCKDGYDVVKTSRTGASPTGLTITGAMKINTGNGDSHVELLDHTTVGSLSVTAGDGNDAVNVQTAAHITGATILNLGNGDNTVSLFDAVFAAFTLTTGDGSDFLHIADNASETTNTTFSGAVSVKMGAGNDFISIGLDATHQAIFAASPSATKFDGGLDYDQMTVVALGTANFTFTPANSPGIEMVKVI